MISFFVLAADLHYGYMEARSAVILIESCHLCWGHKMIYAGVLKPFVGAISVGFLISLIIVIWLMWRYHKWGKDRFLTESLVILVVFIASLI